MGHPYCHSGDVQGHPGTDAALDNLIYLSMTLISAGKLKRLARPVLGIIDLQGLKRLRLVRERQNGMLPGRPDSDCGGLCPAGAGCALRFTRIGRSAPCGSGMRARQPTAAITYT